MKANYLCFQSDKWFQGKNNTVYWWWLYYSVLHLGLGLMDPWVIWIINDKSNSDLGCAKYKAVKTKTDVKLKFWRTMVNTEKPYATTAKLSTLWERDHKPATTEPQGTKDPQNVCTTNMLIITESCTTQGIEHEYNSTVTCRIGGNSGTIKTVPPFGCQLDFIING